MSRSYQGVAEAVAALETVSGSILVALSGGVDSVVLLVALAHLRPKIKIAALHVNHRLRSTALRDEKFVRSLCTELKIPLTVKRLAPAKRGNKNLEAWARAERYAALEATRKKNGHAWIVTAHQADDAAETLLMQLTSNRQLTGISALDQKRYLRRPLLGVSRAAIEAYAQQQGLSWVEDETNADLSLTRNRVRRVILPFLAEQLAGNLPVALSEGAERLHRDVSYLRQAAREQGKELFSLPLGSKLFRAELRRLQLLLPEPLWWRLIEELLLPLIGFRLGAKTALRAATFLLGGGRELCLPNSVRLRKDSGSVMVVRGS